jgi:hypothetical protein
MKSRDILVGVTLIGSTISGCTTEFTGNSSEEETNMDISTTLLEEIGSITVRTSLPPEDISTTIEPSTTLLNPDEILPEGQSQQNSINSYPTISENEMLWENHMLPKEAYTSGAKLGILTVVNPDGEVLVSVPMFSNQNISDTGIYSDQLERGAVLEVAHSDINPEMMSEERGVPDDMGLLGENGTAVIFGHRMSYINPDWDGELETGLEGDSQRVFEKLDLVQEGAQAIIQLDESLGGSRLVYNYTVSSSYEDVEFESGGFNAAALLNARSGPVDNQYLRLLACTPKGSTKDRIAANFVIAR